jgi:hypothetical protein
VALPVFSAGLLDPIAIVCVGPPLLASALRAIKLEALTRALPQVLSLDRL